MVKTDGLRDGGAKRPTDQPSSVDLSIQDTQTGAEIRRQSRDEAIQQTAHETKSVAGQAKRERERGGGEEVSVGSGELRMHPEAKPLV
jgi:hypothetical protein